MKTLSIIANSVACTTVCLGIGVKAGYKAVVAYVKEPKDGYPLNAALTAIQEVLSTKIE